MQVWALGVQQHVAGAILGVVPQHEACKQHRAAGTWAAGAPLSCSQLPFGAGWKRDACCSRYSMAASPMQASRCSQA